MAGSSGGGVPPRRGWAIRTPGQTRAAGALRGGRAALEPPALAMLAAASAMTRLSLAIHFTDDCEVMSLPAVRRQTVWAGRVVEPTAASVCRLSTCLAIPL